MSCIDWQPRWSMRSVARRTAANRQRHAVVSDNVSKRVEMKRILPRRSFGFSCGRRMENGDTQLCPLEHD
ncbi:MAG: hypothetical protein EA424_01265 [Planctomycetaceae bacterium]|nr:MAG: hypothetical protein EA424_01265 [Planctomycetaceae bacterium]